MVSSGGAIPEAAGTPQRQPPDAHSLLLSPAVLHAVQIPAITLAQMRAMGKGDQSRRGAMEEGMLPRRGIFG